MRRRAPGVAAGTSATRANQLRLRVTRTTGEAARGLGRVSKRVAKRIAWPTLFSVLLCGVLFLGVFPTRTYIDKKNKITTAETHLKEVREANAKAELRVDQLESDAEIERVAREQYGLVRRGEEAYHVLPPPKDPIQIPEVWPFVRLRKHAE